MKKKKLKLVERWKKAKKKLLSKVASSCYKLCQKMQISNSSTLKNICLSKVKKLFRIYVLFNINPNNIRAWAELLGAFS